MNKEKKLESFIDAVKYYSTIAQMDFAIEECSYLIQAILKLRRSKPDSKEYAHLEEELMDKVANIEIICKHLGHLTNRTRIEELKSIKLKELRG